MHWADVPSLRWLAYLLNRIEGLPVLLALTARPARSGDTGEALAALRADPAVMVVRPEPLREESVAVLLAEALGAQPDPTFALACHRATAGNPLALRGLIGDLVAGGVQPTRAAAATLEQHVPDTISRRVLGHLARLEASRRQLARALAICGDGSDVRHVAALAELDERRASAAADELVAVDLLRPDRPLRFVHPLLRAAVYDDIPPGARSRLHGRAAALLAASQADPEAVAAHLLRSDTAADPAAMERLLAAAPVALRRGASDAAIAYLRRALVDLEEGPTRTTVLATLGRAEVEAGDPAAEGHLEQAIASCAEPIPRAAIREDLSRMVAHRGQERASRELLRQALEDLRQSGADASVRLEVLVEGRTAMDWREAGAVAVSLPRLRELAQAGGAAAPPAQVTLAWLLGLWGWPRAETLRHLDEGLAGPAFLAEETMDNFWTAWAGVALIITDELERALRWFRDGMAEAARRGSVAGLLNATVFHTWAECSAGLLAEAEADGRASLELAQRHIPFFVPVASAFLATALLDRGDAEGASRVIEAAELPPGLRGSSPELSLLAARGRVRCAVGRAEDGIADLRECGRACDTAGYESPLAWPWRPTLALALARSSPEEARSLVASELEVARRTEIPRAIGVALRTAAALESDATAAELLVESVAVLNASSAPLELTQALVDQGAALRRLGHPADARVPLRRALEIATSRGAVPLAERAHTEALLAGARPRRMRSRGIDALTPGELRVARLAAEGHTNRQIAQALFITAKTVADHLGSAYGKLEITSRAGLASALAQPES